MRTLLRCFGPEASAEMNGSVMRDSVGHRKLVLGALGRFLQTLQRHPVVGQADAGLALEALDEPVDDPLVEVFTAEVRVAGGGEHFEEAVFELEDRDVERAAAEVVDGDALVLLVFETVGQRGGGRLVDDAEHVQPGDLAGIARCLALAVVEVGRHRDDRFRDRLAEELLGKRLDLHQDERGDLFRRVFAVADLDLHVAVFGGNDLIGQDLLRADDLGGVVLAADEPLDGEDGVERIRDGLTLRDLADQPFAVLGEADHRRRGAASLHGSPSPAVW